MTRPTFAQVQVADTFKDQVSLLRQHREISLEGLAAATGLNISLLQAFEAGTQTPDSTELDLLKDALGVSGSWFLV